MRLLQRLIARLRAWREGWGASSLADPPFALPSSPAIHREVSSNGVRVFSLCGSCGARLEASATLCDACAKRRSPSSPF
jgi:hypothetical protein